MDPCWYVTAAWGVHDERWTAALRTQGFEPKITSLTRDELTIDQVRARLLEAANLGDASPVLAGPITTITSSLVGIPQRLIGLSWGFDLLEAGTAPGHLDHLDHLDHLIVDSPASADVAHVCGLQPENITQIYWGTDLDTFTPSGPVADLGRYQIPKGSPTVLSLRAHEDLYRVADLIDAWGSVSIAAPDAHLLIGNQGSRTTELKSRVEAGELASSIHFVGALPEDDLPGLLRSVDLYVSTSPVDGTSVTLLQAMACGCPVLVTDAPGNRHWIDSHVNGYLYPPGNSEQLTHWITTALEDSATDSQSKMIDSALIRVREQADWNTNQRLLREALSPT